MSGFVVVLINQRKSDDTDMQAAYYGYSVIETRVWVNGVVGLGVSVE